MNCAAATFSLHSASICEQCIAGKFSTSDGAPECLACVLGKYFAQGATVCSDCMSVYNTFARYQVMPILMMMPFICSYRNKTESGTCFRTCNPARYQRATSPRSCSSRSTPWRRSRRAALNTVDMDRLWWVEQVLNERKTSFDFMMMMCCLLVLDSVTSTPQWIRKPRPRNMLLLFRIRTTFGAVVRNKRRE